MSIIAVNGISHKTAPIEVREQFSLTATEQEQFLQRLHQQSDITEAVILNTCNRLELYLVAQSPAAILRATMLLLLAKERQLTLNFNYRKFWYQLRDTEVVVHLMRVAASIDSMIIGEPQILGQVKNALKLARSCQTVGPLLNNLFNRAIVFGKRIRTKTNIGKGAVSVPFAAICLIKSAFDSLKDKKIVILGSSKMSEIAARRLLTESQAQLFIASRNVERAREFSAKLPGTTPVEFNFLLSFLEDADAVLTSSSAPHYLVHYEQLATVMQHRQHRPLLIVDIAVPRNVDPNVKEISGITLYNIDDLQNIVDRNLADRQKEADNIERLAQAEAAKFQQWLEVHDIKPVIIAFRQYVQQQCSAEIEHLRRVLGNSLTPEQDKHLRHLAHSIANKIAHQPLIRLKQMVADGKGTLYAEILKDIFSLPQKESTK